MIRERIRESARVKLALLDGDFTKTIADIAAVMVKALRKGRQVLFFGNGGSAADAQHLAAELVGRYYFNRPPLPSLALATNTSCVTAIGNDYGFDQSFSRQLEAHGVAGDVAVGMSTSGASPNVIEALRAGAERLATGTTSRLRFEANLAFASALGSASYVDEAEHLLPGGFVETLVLQRRRAG